MEEEKEKTPQEKGATVQVEDASVGQDEERVHPASFRIAQKKLREELEGLRGEFGEIKELLSSLANSGSSQDASASENGKTSSENEDRPLTMREYRQLEETRSLKSNLQKAYEMITSQKDVRTEDDEDEIGVIMQDYGLDFVARTNPDKAAQKALKLWRESKGITVSREKETASAKASAGIPASSPAAVGGKRVWTASEIKAESERLQSKVESPGGGEEFTKFREEILEAQREGRIKR